MGETTGIAWTDHTVNLWWGCDPVSEGCDHCYWYRDAKRYGHNPAELVRASDRLWQQPLKWEKAAIDAGEVRFVFPCSWSDYRHSGADQWREDAWQLIRDTPHLMWLILTKRPENIADRLPADWGQGYPNVALGVTAENQQRADKRMSILDETPAAYRFVSAEPLLGALDLSGRLGYVCPSCGEVGGLHVPRGDVAESARWRWTGSIWEHHHGYPIGHVACEHRIDWVICGGETGPGARPTHPDWVRSLRDQCANARVPFFFKQWGEWMPTSQMSDEFADTLYHPAPEDDPGAIRQCETQTGVLQLDGSFPDAEWPKGAMMMFRVGTKRAGNLLDGVVWQQRLEVRNR